MYHEIREKNNIYKTNKKIRKTRNKQLERKNVTPIKKRKKDILIWKRKKKQKKL